MTDVIISAVTGTWNRITLLQKMVKSVRDNIPIGISYEIIVVDGNSTDGTIEWCEAQSDIVLVKQRELVGAIRAFGAGFDIVRGQYTLILNDDIELLPDAVMLSLVHLQDHPRCGIAAISDNRKQHHKHDGYDVDYMPAMREGRPVSVPYGQICLVRTYLGKFAGWWGHKDPAYATSRTYAGDNRLSAKVFEMGYTVEKVIGAMAFDHVEHDELRTTNRDAGSEDSMNYYRDYPRGGPSIPPAPTLQQQDTPTIRVLYLPIYEPGWAVQKQQKRGLRNALLRARTPKGWGISVYELDYMAIPPDRLEAELLHAAEVFQPRLILTQIQGHLPITAEMLSKLRSLHPRASIINWNGDQAEGGLITPEMIKLLRQVDLQLVVNASALETYEKHGIPAAYWQIGFEEPQGALPEMPAHDVVFLGSFNNPKRLPLKAALEKLRDEQVNVGIYQPGDLSATLYDFAKGKALYNQAKIAVGSNEYPDSKGFVSNRLFQAIAAGGCLYFQQKVEALDSLTGLQANTHFVEWDNFATLRAKVLYYLDPLHIAERRAIADAGTAFVRERHSFDARVKELFALMKQHLQPYQSPDGNAVYLKYIGRNPDPFGIPSKTNERLHYQRIPGKLLLVDNQDVPYFLSQHDLWELAETE
jgi:glycosyltransferase involved in cell wall biosynthesis